MINPSGRMQESEIFNLKLWYSWIMNLHSGGWFIKTDSLHNFLTYTNLKKLLALRCQVKKFSVLYTYTRELQNVTFPEKFKPMTSRELILYESYFNTHTTCSPQYVPYDQHLFYRKNFVGLGMGHKRSRAFEAFVMEKRQYLRNVVKLCERGCQKVLAYSNNFLHKRLRTEKVYACVYIWMQ